MKNKNREDVLFDILKFFGIGTLVIIGLFVTICIFNIGIFFIKIFWLEIKDSPFVYYYGYGYGEYDVRYIMIFMFGLFCCFVIFCITILLAASIINVVEFYVLKLNSKKIEKLSIILAREIINELVSPVFNYKHVYFTLTDNKGERWNCYENSILEFPLLYKKLKEVRVYKNKNFVFMNKLLNTKIKENVKQKILDYFELKEIKNFKKEDEFIGYVLGETGACANGY